MHPARIEPLYSTIIRHPPIAQLVEQVAFNDKVARSSRAGRTMKRTFKETCIELRKRDRTLNEIMAITGRSKTSIYAHIRDIPLSQRKRAQIAENSRRLALGVASARRGVALRPFKPFQHWTPETVLVTAHLMFDGRLGKSCDYNNRSVALINRVKHLMTIVYDFPPRPYINLITGVLRISYHNVALANFFKAKSNELLNNIEKLPLPCQKEFLRAFFDDEGCMDARSKKRMVRGYQNDQSVLLIVRELLKNFKIESKLAGRNEVVINGKENLIKFRDEINFSKGVRINPKRTNSLWKKNLEKRKLLDMAIASFKK